MKLTNNCYAVLGLGYYPPWIVNAGFIAGESKTLIVDSGPNFLSAQTLYGYAQSARPGNELVLINTEKHLDHILGNSFFKEKGLKIFGHKEIKRLEDDLQDEKNYFNKSILSISRQAAREEEIFFQKTKIVNPEFAVEDKQIFQLGGDIDAQVIYTFGHTLTNISIYIPQDKVLYCGDCIINGYIPNLEAGDKQNWETWLESLERIKELDLNYIVPGHGNVLRSTEIMPAIKRIQNFLKSAIKEGIAPTSEL